MDVQTDQQRISPLTPRRYATVYAPTLLLLIAGGLLLYKGSAALVVMKKVHNARTFQPRLNVIPMPGSAEQLGLVARSVNYFSVIWPALLFGILISGAVRVLDPPRWLARAMGRGRVRSQLAAGLAGAPLMLCSCCVAPMFAGVYERSSKLGPSLALMLAAPALNPAALILTFMLFDYRLATTRLGLSACAVFFTGALIERFIQVKPSSCIATSPEVTRDLLLRFLGSGAEVAVRTVPPIVIGVLISMAIALWLPIGVLASARTQFLATVVVAMIAIPLAMPTFFEIALALVLLSVGAPAGAGGGANDRRPSHQSAVTIYDRTRDQLESRRRGRGLDFFASGLGGALVSFW
jgi:uncharacterized membrane protein YraQ (UPF0718 family)